MPTRTLMTAEQFDQLPEEETRYELLDGELIEVPSATLGHNVIQAILLTSLMNFLLQTLRGMAFAEMYVHTLAGARRLIATDCLDSPLLPGWSIVVSNLFAWL